MAISLGPPRDIIRKMEREYLPPLLGTDFDNIVISKWECAQTPLGYRIMVGFHHRHEVNPLNRVLHMRVDDIDSLKLMFHGVTEVGL